METVLLGTAHLILRNFRESDLDAVLAFRSDSEVCRHIGEPMSAREVAAHIARFKEGWSRREGETLRLAVELRGEGKVIGEAMLRYLSVAQRQAELGAALGSRRRDPKPSGERARLGLEVCLALFRYGFEELGIHRMIGFVDVENEASLRLTDSMGMRREGLLRKNVFRRGEWRDEHLTALIEDEWPALRRRFEHLLVPAPSGRAGSA